MSAGLPLSRLPDEQPRLDGSIHISGPHTCYHCGSSSADVVLESFRVTDPESGAVGEKWFCVSVIQCADRIAAAAPFGSESEPGR